MEGRDEDGMRKEYAECDITYSMETIWKRFKGMNIAGRFVFKKQIDECAFPTTTSMVPPLSKMKTKGPPKKRKEYDVARDPSYFEYVDEAMKNDTQNSVDKQRNGH